MIYRIIGEDADESRRRELRNSLLRQAAHDHHYPEEVLRSVVDIAENLLGLELGSISVRHYNVGVGINHPDADEKIQNILEQINHEAGIPLEWLKADIGRWVKLRRARLIKLNSLPYVRALRAKLRARKNEQ